MTDELFIQMLTIIVQRNGCTVSELDLDKRIANIDGPVKGRIKCAQELSELLEDYLV
jgi:hypothetical protein